MVAGVRHAVAQNALDTCSAYAIVRFVAVYLVVESVKRGANVLPAEPHRVFVHAFVGANIEARYQHSAHLLSFL